MSMLTRRILITGMGLVGPLGRSCWSSFAAALAGRTLADRLALLPADVVAVDRVRFVGSAGSAALGADDPAIELAEIAGREALDLKADAGIATWIATSKGALTTAAKALTNTGHPAASRAVALGPAGWIAHRLAARLPIDPQGAVVAACASGLVALHRAWTTLRHRGLDGARALVVAADAPLLPVLIHSYRRLGVLADGAGSRYVARPLDPRRSGFVLSEMAAAVRLEVVDRPARPGDVELLDIAVGCEAFDLIRPAPQRPALRQVVGQLASGPPVDMVHPHAPGTWEATDVEMAVLHGQWPNAAVYADKGAWGHGLGAAGLASLIMAVLIGRSRRIPPMPWMEQPPVQHLQADAAATHHVVLAAGFAGHVAGARLLVHGRGDR